MTVHRPVSVSRRAAAWFAIAWIALSPASFAADEASSPPPGPCDGAEHRQFDFWLGSWRVTTADGKLAGHNRIEKILGGCVVRERWTGASGTAGESYNLYSARDGGWHQTWVDSNGQMLLLDGAFSGDRMVLAGVRPGADGRPVRHRITWQPLDDGTVRQHWQASSDGGKSWNDLFLGNYHREDR